MKLYIQLGRAGDILNILPLCKRYLDETGEAPLLMVAEPFAGLLDGVSYVKLLVWRGRFEDIAGAYREAELVAAKIPGGAKIVCTQIYGENLYCFEACSSFVRESWTRDPSAPAWGTLPLVFDRRDPDREAAVVAQLRRRSTGKPYVVLALEGTSSPFEHSGLVAEELRRILGKQFDFVDVSGFVAPRFFDLLGLLEGAHALVSIDAGVLHLAHAVPGLPVVSFITRDPSGWHGSAWRANHVGRHYYDEVAERLPEIAMVVAAARNILSARLPTIWQVTSDFAPELRNENNLRRTTLARKTWEAERANADWRLLELRIEDGFRSSAIPEIGDPSPVPFMHDLIELALKEEPHPLDIIAMTNVDVCFCPGITGLIRDAVYRRGCAYTHRWDFHAPIAAPLRNEAEVRRGEWYPGSDAFFFTVEWWLDHRAEYPDMLVGREQNDEVLRQLIKRHGGAEIPAAIYHEKHASYWEHHGNRVKNPGNEYNRKLAKKWFLRTGYRPNDPEWWKI